MTCKEKLKLEHPEMIDEKKPGGCFGCPDTYGYLDKPVYCSKRFVLGPSVCEECWSREAK